MRLPTLIAHVLVSPLVAPTLPGEGILAFPETLKLRLQDEARRQLDTLVAAHGASEVSGELLWDTDVAHGLVSMDSGSDLLVVASTGKGSLEATLLGSTSERMLRLATGPVLILPSSMTRS